MGAADMKALELESAEALERFIGERAGAVVYFGAPDCGVCHVLKPKLLELLGQRFPALAFGLVDCRAHPDLAALHSVFTVPVLLVFLDGREVLRRSRAFSPAEVAAELARPYHLLFGDS